MNACQFLVLLVKFRTIYLPKPAGSPSDPQCGFSRKIVGILKDNKVKFDSFDILTDDEVRQGMNGVLKPNIFPPKKTFGLLAM